ncbi:hypothetical protein SAMN02910369_01686 [Lachnospiraceae bacterium NE2001]|nr:hypothetical protein SAMN02910369_01686 [Lachnospiraceae bacterium NE2001]
MSLFGNYGKMPGLFQEVKCFFQRGKKGYCDKDIWELNTWMTTTFAQMLREFREKAYDYPPGFSDNDEHEIPAGIIASHVLGNIVSEEDYKEYLDWKNTVLKMSYYFENAVCNCG